MVYDNKSVRKQKGIPLKLVFSTILIVYVSGLCCGCAYAVRNSRNMDFIAKVTLTEILSESGNNGDFAGYIRFFIRDIISIILIWMLKNSGVIKGMCLCVPFVVSLQNSAVYVSGLYRGLSLFSLILKYIIRDTSIGFLIILYSCITVSDIISDRIDTKRDLRKTAVYISGIVLIYIIDYSIKTMFS